MRVSVRREEILRILDEQAEVTVKELASHFGVSTVTIRTDLDALRSRGALRRLHGGAKLLRTDEGGFGYRASQSQDEKRAIARMAAPTICDGDVIALDSSSTSYYLAQELSTFEDVTVVTPALRTAMWLAERTRLRVWILGGCVRRASASTNAATLDRTGLPPAVDKGFFSMNRITPTGGLYEISEEEAAAKKRLLSICRKKYAVADASKFTGPGDHLTVEIAGLSGLFTDSTTPDSLLEGFRARHLPVHVAYVSPGPSPARTAARLKEVG